MMIQELKDSLGPVVDEIAEVAGYLWEKGWAAVNAGNVSVDVTELLPPGFLNIHNGGEPPEDGSDDEIFLNGVPRQLAGRSLLMTATGSRCRDMVRKAEANLLLVRIPETLDRVRILRHCGLSGGRPTNELAAHLKIHGLLRTGNAEERAILHSHPKALLALTHKADYGSDRFQGFLWSTHVAAKAFLPDGVGMARYQQGGSHELADATADLFRRHRAVLWEKHGCTTTGSGVAQAFDLMDLLNSAAEVYLLCRQAGIEPGPPGKQP